MLTPKRILQITPPEVCAQQIDQWVNGPNFLRGNEENWPTRPDGINVLPNEALEWRKNVQIYETQAQQVKPLDVFIRHYSSWYHLQKGVAWLIRFTNHLRVLRLDRSPKDQA